MNRPEPALANKGPGTSPAQLEVVPQEQQFAPNSNQTSGYGKHVTVRLTRSVFDDLAIWMIGAGVIIGAIFPPMLVGLGVCLLAGIVVGGVNIRLMRVVVMPRLRALVDGMRMIESVVESATYTGDWMDCDPESCQPTLWAYTPARDRGQTISCTVSLGFGSFPATPAEDETALIRVADEALYRAKNDGRNRTVEAA